MRLRHQAVERNATVRLVGPCRVVLAEHDVLRVPSAHTDFASFAIASLLSQPACGRGCGTQQHPPVRQT